MRRAFGLTVTGVLVVLGLCVLVSAAPFMRDYRVAYAERYLSETIGQTVIVDGDVRLSFRPDVAIIATRLRLPGASLTTKSLVELDTARLSLFSDLTDVPIPRIRASNALILFFQDAEGRATWDQTAGNGSDTEAGVIALLDFLWERDILLENVEMEAQNERSGFTFSFDMDAFEIAQDATGRATFTSNGIVNGTEYQADGEFFADAPFSFVAKVGDEILTMDGQNASRDGEEGFEARVTLELKDLEEFLDILKLDSDIMGAGTATAELSSLGGQFSLSDIDVNLTLEGGTTAAITGNLARTEPRIDLNVALEMAGRGRGPRANFWQGLRVEFLEGDIVGNGAAFELRDMIVETNDAELAFREIGPISVGRIARTDDGRLEVRDVYIPFGPPDAKVADLTGSIGNILGPSDFLLTGTLDMPARTLLVGLSEDVADTFGRARGTMEVSDVDGIASLSTFEVGIEDSEIWSGDIFARVPDMKTSNGIELGFDLLLLESDRFLSGLGLSPQGAGRVAVSLEALFSDILSVESTITVDGSDIATSLQGSLNGRIPTITGKVSGDEVRWRDLSGAASVVSEFARSGEDLADLVMTDRVEEFIDHYEASRPEEEETPQVPWDTIASRFLPPESQRLSIEDFANIKDILLSGEAEIELAIKRVTGVDFLQSLETNATLKNASLSLGPLPLEFGDGRADVTASSDLSVSPARARLVGTTEGWDLGDTLAELGVTGYAADGTISGRFNLSGPINPLEGFIAGMRGSTDLFMTNARLGTSLLELAGLGVLPWLFSEELAAGQTAINCMRAPLRLSPGRIDIPEGVLETRQVQVVVEGSVDWAGNQISLKGDPRPIGQPLGSNAFPFILAGPLNSPELTLDDVTRRTATRPLEMPADRKPCVPDVKQLIEPG